jgi:hypothetical protein
LEQDLKCVILTGICGVSTSTGVYYSGITLFNSLHLNIKKVAHNINKFKHELRKFLMENSFYSVEEYFDRNNKFDLGVSQLL